MKHLLPFVTGASLALAAAGAGAQQVVSYTKTGASFDAVREELKIAIENRGLVIDFEAHVSSMLDRTGKDLGATNKLYVDARAFQFCSAALSRRMMEADAANVVFCPYTIVVYATAERPEQVHVAYRRPLRPGAGRGSRAALREVDALLGSIAREAVGRRP